MPPDLALPRAQAPALSAEWRAALVRLALVWLALLGLGWRQWAAMADQWWNSSTYTHVLLVPAIIGWLVSQRTEQLRQMQPRAWAMGLAPFALAALAWLAGQLAGVAMAEQLGAVLLLASAVPVLLGPRLATALAFPLGYMLVLVPFGDELVPLLQTITARMTVAQLLESPAVIDAHAKRMRSRSAAWSDADFLSLALRDLVEVRRVDRHRHAQRPKFPCRLQPTNSPRGKPERSTYSHPLGATHWY